MRRQALGIASELFRARAADVYIYVSGHGRRRCRRGGVTRFFSSSTFQPSVRLTSANTGCSSALPPHHLSRGFRSAQVQQVAGDPSGGRGHRSQDNRRRPGRRRIRAPAVAAERGGPPAVGTPRRPRPLVRDLIIQLISKCISK